MSIVSLKNLSHEEWLKERAQDLTSTDCATLFRASPYSTYFEMWHKKRSQQVVEIEQNERMKWGGRLEATIAQGIAEDLNIEVAPFKEYLRNPVLRLGSSFDFQIGDKGILEIKNVDRLVFKNDWLDGDDIEAPLHIQFQCQHQLFVSGRESVLLGALVGGNELFTTQILPDDRIFRAIEDKSKIFWQSIIDGIEPSPDWEKDAEFIISMNQFSKKDLEAEPTPQIEELAAEYKRCSDNVKFWESGKEIAKAKLLEAIGPAERCRSKLFSLSAKMTAETMVPSYTRKAFRNFRLTYKGE